LERGSRAGEGLLRGVAGGTCPVSEEAFLVGVEPGPWPPRTPWDVSPSCGTSGGDKGHGGVAAAGSRQRSHPLNGTSRRCGPSGAHCPASVGGVGGRLLSGECPGADVRSAQAQVSLGKTAVPTFGWGEGWTLRQGSHPVMSETAGASLLKIEEGGLQRSHSHVCAASEPWPMWSRRRRQLVRDGSSMRRRA
jgi:hypothetical protein